MTTIKTLTTPSGTTGMAVAPWSDKEIYAVAANWAEAASPILVYGEGGWSHDDCGRQVADFRHNSRAALAEILREAIEAGGDDPDDEEIEEMIGDAHHIGN